MTTQIQNAGRLRHQIDIQHNTGITRNSFGEEVEVWVTFKKRQADVRPIRSFTGERYQARQMQATITHGIEMRYTAGVLPDMRIVFRGRTFGVDHWVNLDERNRRMFIFAIEVQ